MAGLPLLQGSSFASPPRVFADQLLRASRLILSLGVGEGTPTLCIIPGLRGLSQRRV